MEENLRVLKQKKKEFLELVLLLAIGRRSALTKSQEELAPLSRLPLEILAKIFSCERPRWQYMKSEEQLLSLTWFIFYNRSEFERRIRNKNSLTIKEKVITDERSTFVFAD